MRPFREAWDSVSVKVENLDHLGIVAGIIDKIGLVDIIDENLGRHIAACRLVRYGLRLRSALAP
ncbi:MAG: DUF4277 domain-containing protein [Cyanobacteriota bacterium]